MDNMLPTEDEWMQVRRRKHQQRRVPMSDETTFFVTNIPNGATKTEFKKIFSSFGRLSDVFFVDKKGKDRKNFGFIRYLGVESVKEMEPKLNGVKCIKNILEINLEKHGRKVPLRGHFQSNRAWKNRTNSVQTILGISKARTTFPHPPPPPPPPTHILLTTLQVDKDMDEWIHKSTLIGEALSLSHLGYALMSIHSDIGVEVKYVGGMQAILCFKSMVDANKIRIIDRIPSNG
ncbi:unnamed protein product [Lactuca saligna]|uniref:RRM domain-containing protein n=1 Tax=Lactuca saligna TaxID=75948 RepID=A0AA35YI76_LACSI|nr:unnamed protein product [Lactuca saligna]